MTRKKAVTGRVVGGEFIDPSEMWFTQSFVYQNQQFLIGKTENVTHHFIIGLLHLPHEINTNSSGTSTVDRPHMVNRRTL
ncbi:MAG: hypothetical protein HON04_08935 [Planctomicrobium sp.]|nr:hypothetical protein [Planctomicrobium sp.]